MTEANIQEKIHRPNKSGIREPGQSSKRVAMSTYKHLVRNNNNMLQRLSKASGVRTELVQGILWFSKCLVKPGMEFIDLQIFSVVMSTYMGISDQNSIQKVYNRLVSSHTGLSIEQFSSVMCLFFSENLDMQIDYVFSLFDSNNDGMIYPADISNFIKTCKCVTDTDEAEKDETFVDLSNMVFDILSMSQLEGINLEAFRAKVKKNTIILRMLGQNLPTQIHLDSFRHKIMGKTNVQILEAFGNIRSDLLFEPPECSVPKYYPVQLDLP